jgi:hypothetical protein
VGIVRSAELPDPYGFLESTGKHRRYAAFTRVSDLLRPWVKPLINLIVAIVAALAFAGFAA